MALVFGTWGENAIQYRAMEDLYATQLISDYISSFIRTLDPNPSLDYLTVRNYTKTLDVVKNLSWKSINSTEPQGSVQRLDYPATADTFIDTEQCKFLNFPIDYYLQ